MANRAFQSRAALLLVATALSLVSCSDQQSANRDPISVQPTQQLVVVSGNNQTARVDNDVPTPLVVRLMDGTGRPVKDAPIYWTVVSGEGYVVATATNTDDQGYAEAVWTLGRMAAEQRVRASFGATTALFSAVATAGDPATIVTSGGDNQSALAGTQLTDSISIKVSDTYGNPVPGVVVNWEVLYGTGVVNPLLSLTNDQGIARTSWTLGPELGASVVRGQVADIGEARFSATAVDVDGRSYPLAVSTVVLTPAGIALSSIGAEASLVATAYNASGNRVANAAIHWLSLGASIATVNENGKVTAVSPGSTRIVANAVCCNKADTTNVIVAQQATSLSVSPKPANVPVAGALTLTATARDANGNFVSGMPVFWSSSNTSVATVNQGVVTGLKSGTAKIRAASGSLVDSVAVTVGTVTISPVVASVRVTPANANVEVAKIFELSGVALDATGSPISGQALSWSSSNTSVASVSSNGRVTGLAAGSATITAAVGEKRASAQITVTAPAAALASVSVTPASSSLSTGATLQLNASARDANGNSLNGYNFAWSTMQPSVATVTATGLVTALATGTATISASAGGKIASATITVTAALQLARLVLSPDTLKLTALGAQSAVTTTAYDAAGKVLPAAAVTWKTSNAMVASVDSVGKVTARGLGKALIIASALCCNKADTTTAVVTQQITSLTVSPHSTSVATGGSSTLTAIARDANANVVSNAPVTWSSTNPTVATVSNGVVSGLVSGTAVIRATSGTLKDSAVVSVSSTASVLTSISMSPAGGYVGLGGSQQVTATARDASGNSMSGYTFTWTSSNPAVATVSANGLVQGLTAGSATITAATGGKSTHAVFTVAAPGALGFNDNFETGTYAGVKGGSWIGGGSGNVFVGPGGNASSYALNLIHRGKPVGLMSTAEQRFKLATPVTEIWLEYDFFLPANFYHRDPGGANNKFLALWEDDYSGLTPTGDPAAQLIIEFRPMNDLTQHAGINGDSYLTVQGNTLGSTSNATFGKVMNFFTDAERGKWNRVQWHIRLASAATKDGVVELYMNGVKRISNQAANLPSVVDGRYFRYGYFLGWANSGYDADTEFKIDNVRFYSSNPGW